MRNILAFGLSGATAVTLCVPAMAGPTPACVSGAGPLVAGTECGLESFTGTANVATAIGAYAHATENFSTAVGDTSEASGINSTALGAQAHAEAAQSTAVGVGSLVSATNSVAIGVSSVADQANTVSVGSVGSERRVVNVAAGSVSATSTDAINGLQLHETNQIVAAQGAQITALDSQVQVTSQTVATQGTQITTLQTTAGEHETRLTALEAITGNLVGLQGSVDTLFGLRNRDRRDMKQGIAAAMAMADAPMPSRPGGVSYQVKAGTFRGEHAVSGALTYRLNTGSPMAVSGGVSYGGSKNNGATVAFSGEF
jgi:autotransporter adhesin